MEKKLFKFFRNRENLEVGKISIFVSVFLSCLILLSVFGIPAEAAVRYPPGSLLQTGDVTSNHIRDGEIVNADVNNSAAIVWSKISKTGSSLADIATRAITDLTGTLLVEHGGTGLASTTAYALLTGGTTSTGNLQQVSSLGTAGQVLVSNGAGALPSFQTAGGSKLALDLTATTISANGSSGNETTLYTYNLPANTLGTSNIIKVTLFLSAIQSDNSNPNTFDLKAKYGGTTMITLGSIAPMSGAGQGAQYGYIEFYIFGDGATNSQHGWAALNDWINNAQAKQYIMNIQATGTATEDSTAEKAITITIDWSSNNSGNTLTSYAALVEVIK